MFINNLSIKNSVFGSDFNSSLCFTKDKYKSSEFDFFESRLRKIYQRLALGANFANNN